MPSSEKWIGVASVRPVVGKDPLGPGVKGAFVTIVALAKGAAEFEAAVRDALALYDLVLDALEDVDQLDRRLMAFAVDPVLLRDAEAIPKTTTFVFGAFHSFPEGHGG
jgi:hypothetical protein